MNQFEKHEWCSITKRILGFLIMDNFTRSSVIFLTLFSIIFFLSATAANAQNTPVSNLERLMPKIDLVAIYPDADHIGDPQGSPKASPAYGASGEVIGYVFVNTDYVPTIGYSGKPIHVAVAMDIEGNIQGASLLEHSEPIVLVGIPNSKIKAFIDSYVGLNAITLSSSTSNDLPVDIVSGATVTVIVIDVSIKRSAVLLAQSRNIGNLKEMTRSGASLRSEITDISDWETMLEEGSVRRLLLTNHDVDQAFIDLGNAKAIARPEKGEPDEAFIDLYTGLASQPSIGRTLLGEREYNNLADRLADNQHAILIMANGQYSYRGSGFVRGGIFDRFQIIQGTKSWLFRDKAYKNIGNLSDGPAFSEVGLFRLPDDGSFDPTEPWRVQLLIQRAIGPIEKTFVIRSLNYILPPRYIASVSIAEPAAASEVMYNGDVEITISPIIQTIWTAKKTQVVILAIALILLTAIFYGQIQLAARPKWLMRVRFSFLLFSLVWLGWYANAQLSVVNVLIFLKAFIGTFNWNYFMMDPLLFILWGAVAAAMILWGRGVFCGWLCPFGALQEILNMAAKKIKIPQYKVPWALHELLLSVKYLVFLGLFGLSFYSIGLAEQVAEIEPFKTAIILKFAREWPYVIYALTLLSIGLVIERFYCRYICPLGAALAIPARLRTNDWLKRYFMCGNSCQRCANECMVQAIRPDGQIHPNECINCMHCQELYSCSTRCPVMTEKQKRTEKRLRSAALSTSKSVNES